MSAFRNVTKLIPKSPSVPEKWKGGRLSRVVGYFRQILEDYKMVLVETGQDMKAAPLKSAVILSGLASVCYLIKTNPSAESFYTQLVENTDELLQLSDLIRNPMGDNHMQQLVAYQNRGLLRRLNLGVCSLMWVDNFDKEVDLFEAHCKSLKVGWLDLKERVVDIGVLKRWIYLERAMVDYDINPKEWEGESNESKPVISS